MAPIVNYEQHSSRLIDPDLPLQIRLQMAMEVRNSLGITHTPGYLNFLKCYLGAFESILITLTKPQSYDNAEHKLRKVVVDILNLLPHSDALRPFVQDLHKLLLTVLTTDNEDNALIAVRIILDLFGNFRPTVESEVQSFLNFVISIYRNFPETVNQFFSHANFVDLKLAPKGEQVDEGCLHAASIASFGQLNPSILSFKLVTKIPLVVMFLFKLYTSLVPSNICSLLPLMVHAISIPGPEKVLPHLKTQFIDLKDAQVKTLSFLIYLLKSSADFIRPHGESICKSIVNLLVTCDDLFSIRRELLLALKNVLSTDFKKGLFPLIHTLLDERFLLLS